MGVSLDNSIEFHKRAIFETGGLIPVVSTITGACRIVSAVGLIVISGVNLVVNAPLALGEMVFTDKTTFQKKALTNIAVIFHNIMQILHGVIDAIPIIGNIPYWIKAACCKKDADETVHTFDLPDEVSI